LLLVPSLAEPVHASLAATLDEAYFGNGDVSLLVRNGEAAAAASSVAEPAGARSRYELRQERRAAVVTALQRYCEVQRGLPPEAEPFLAKALASWDGHGPLLGLLPWLTPQDPSRWLDAVGDLAVVATPTSQAHLLAALTALLRRWCSAWKRRRRAIPAAAADSPTAAAMNTPSAATTTVAAPANILAATTTAVNLVATAAQGTFCAVAAPEAAAAGSVASAEATTGTARVETPLQAAAAAASLAAPIDTPCWPASSSSSSSLFPLAAWSAALSSWGPLGQQHLEAVHSLGCQLDRMATLLLVASEDHVVLQLAVLDLLDLMAAFNTDFDLPFILPPSPGVTYRLLLASNALAVSRIAGVLQK
jgi:hypothetical protein